MKRNACFAWVLALLLAFTPLCVQAEPVDDVWNRATGGAPAQNWLDGELAAGAGSASDNYVLCLIRSGAEVDYSRYAESAAAKLEDGISNAGTRERTALCLIACGAADRVPADTVDESAGKLGAMSWVWALHLLNNGAESAQFTAESVAGKLLELQLEDGGWRVSGEGGDVDVTAMALQALACCEVQDAALDAAVERALGFLSEHQRASGGFASMGVECAESAAQVLIALSALGISKDDPRFVKDGRTALDALLGYELPTGGFEHTSGSGENPTATAQALQALIALDMPGEPFYAFAGASASAAQDSGSSSGESTGERAGAQVSPAALLSTLPVWKLCAFSAIGALALAGAIFALTRKRARGKHLLAVLLAAAIAAGTVWFVRIDSAADYYDPDALSAAGSGGSVTLSIVCESVAGRADDGSTPEDGVILPPTQIPISDGDSVFDALTAAVRANSLQLEYEGSEAMAYVTAINNLYEFAYGDLSGWLYSVNGERVSLSCGSCELRDGDAVLWEYTTDIGGDMR